MALNTVETEHNIDILFEPRSYQMEAFDGLLSGKYNRVITVWHRRAGKDLVAFNALWISAMRRVGNYGYFFPFGTQGRRAIWHGITNESIPYKSFIPSELIANEHDTEMRITLVNGSTIQFIGTDNIDAKMGANFAGVIMSEYPLQNPQAWKLIEPILKLNGGWAWFPYTPRGRENHGYNLYEAGSRLMARGEPWFVQKLGIDDTGLLADSDLDDLREQGTEEELIRQEYYCDFGVTNFSSYFGRKMEDAREEGRINSDVRWIPDNLVHTTWDFGVNDMTTIWFFQEGPYGAWHMIDYLEGKDEGLNYYIKELNEKPYTYGTHLAPHDVKQREFQTGVSIQDAAWALGVWFTDLPRISKRDQRDATHRILPRIHFNIDTTYDGVAAMRNYERKWDDKLHVFSDKALHNWASHGADSFMNFACGYQMIESPRNNSKLPTTSVGGNFDPRS